MEMCNAEGHILGMLDRDQRTAKILTFDKHVVFANGYEDSPGQTVKTKQNKVISHRSVPRRTSPHSSCKTRKNGHFWKSLHRLKHALIVWTYLSLLAFPSVLSAPTIRRSVMSSRAKADPKWLNPCGISGANGAASDHRVSDSRLITAIIDMANIVEAKAKAFKEDFVRRTFNMDIKQLHNYYKDKDYEWLPTKKIPKKLNQPVPQAHLNALEYKATLLVVYSYLQKFAVGIEQIVWDEQDRKGEFRASFVDTENQLRTLLCEIHMAIIENDLTIKENVTRDVMGQEFRNMDNTNINVRNWIIFRDYLNMLEYTIQVFNHFKTTSLDQKSH